MSKGQHGGARKGAGRTPSMELTSIQRPIRFPPSLMERLDRHVDEEHPSFNKLMIAIAEEWLKGKRKR